LTSWLTTSGRFKPLFAGILLLLSAVGCTPRPSTKSGPEDAPGQLSQPDIVWAQTDLDHQGASINLGYRARSAADSTIRAVASVVRDDEPVASAMVFVDVVSTSTDETAASTAAGEKATVYEPATDDSPAHYISEPVSLPAGSKDLALRFRIVLPEAEDDFVHQVPLQ
jgi:hypothetical protein